MKNKILIPTILTVLATCMNVAVAKTSVISTDMVSYSRQPTKEQLLTSLNRLRLDDNSDKEIQQFLQDKLKALYGVEYSPNEEISEETQVFLTMQDNAKAPNTATGQDLWYYSLIIREPRVRKQLNLNFSQSKADELADELQLQAVAKGDLSALTKTGYDNIVKAIGEPIYSQEKIDGSYRAYHDVTLKNPEALQQGLQELANTLKFRCLVDYYPGLDYPFYYHHVYRETGEITMNRNRPVGQRLDEFPRLQVAKYPDSEDLLDLIYLRHYTYCYERDYIKHKLAGYLTGQTDGDIYRTYSIPKPKNQSSLRESVILSILAELVDLPELVPVFSYPMNETEKTEFNQQRHLLTEKYHKLYADSVPIDMDIE